MTFFVSVHSVGGVCPCEAVPLRFGPRQVRHSSASAATPGRRITAVRSAASETQSLKVDIGTYSRRKSWSVARFLKQNADGVNQPPPRRDNSRDSPGQQVYRVGAAKRPLPNGNGLFLILKQRRRLTCRRAACRPSAGRQRSCLRPSSFRFRSCRELQRSCPCPFRSSKPPCPEPCHSHS